MSATVSADSLLAVSCFQKFKVATAEATVHKVDASQFPKLTRVLDLALQNDLGQAAADKRPIGAVLNSAMVGCFQGV